MFVFFEIIPALSRTRTVPSILQNGRVESDPEDDLIPPIHLLPLPLCVGPEKKYLAWHFFTLGQVKVSPKSTVLALLDFCTSRWNNPRLGNKQIGVEISMMPWIWLLDCSLPKCCQVSYRFKCLNYVNLFHWTTVDDTLFTKHLILSLVPN